MRRLPTSIFALAACLPLFLAGPVTAADIGGAKDTPAYGGSDWELEGIKVGGIVIVAPTYEGSEEYEVLGFPYILPLFSGGPGFFSRFDARGLDDIRFKLIDRDGFVAGPLSGYNLGRDEDDGDLLEGMGDVDGGVVLGGFASYGWDWLRLDLSYHHTLGDDGGYQLRFGVESERRISDRTLLTGRVGTTYADDSYMDNYFGVSAAQAANSDNDFFDAEAGFKDVHAQIGIKTELDERWSLRATLRYSHLLGDAADSPIVETESQFLGVLGVSYRFDAAY